MKNNSNKTSFEKAMEYVNQFPRMDMSKIPDIDENQTDEELEKELEEIHKKFEAKMKGAKIIWRER